MAILKDSLITGDLRVTGTIYGNANLGTLNASGTGIGTNGQILTSTGTGLAWSNNVAPSSHTHAAGDITSGTLGVARGGTGATTFSSGQLLIGNGASAVTTRAIKNMTAKSDLGWTASGTDIYIPTVNTLAYWNGRYNSTSSNLEYCSKGAFGAAVTYAVDDATANGALGTSQGLTTERSVYYGLVTVNNASQTRATGIYAPTAAGSNGQYLKSSGGTNAPTWASFTKPSVTWTGGTSNGPTLKITTDGGASDAVAVPSAGASASGIVTTGSQTFAGTKTFNGDSFYVQANEVRFKNKGNNNTAITNKPYSFRLNIGDGEYIHLSEYNDDDLEIHGSSILLTTTNYAIYNETAAYSAGNIVWYNGQYYRCTTAIASGGEAWTSSHWTALPMTAIMAANHINPWVTETYDLGSSSYKWNNLYAKKINGTAIASVTAQTTQAVYPIKINAIGQITAYGSAVTLGTLAGKSSIANHTYVKATGTSRSTDVTLDSTTVNSITAVGTLPSLTITSTTVVTGGSTTNIPNISKKTVVTDATAAKATYANGILSISDGSVTKGDSVGVGTAIAAYTSLTSGSVGSASDWSAGTLPTKGSNTTVATTVKTQPTFSITTENATLSHTIS